MAQPKKISDIIGYILAIPFVGVEFSKNLFLNHEDSMEDWGGFENAYEH